MRPIVRHPRAGPVVFGDGLVHVPTLFVSDHAGAFEVGFLAGRLRHDEPEAWPLRGPNPAWAAPQKFERRK